MLNRTLTLILIAAASMDAQTHSRVFMDWRSLDFAMIDTIFPQEIVTWIEAGEYSKASAAIDALADRTESSDLREAMRWQAERLRRIAQDYRLTRDDVLRLTKERIDHFQNEEFEGWLSEDKLDWRIIDGEERFMGSAVSNLYFRYNDIRARWLRPGETAFQRSLAKIAALAKDPATRNDPLLSPRRYRIRMTVQTHADEVAPGEIVRCWVPFPQENSFQTEVELLRASPDPISIAPADAPHRSVYFEQPAVAGTPTVFEIEYTFTAQTRYFDLDPDAIRADFPKEVEIFTQEQPPHVVFTPELIALANEIVGDETNPYWIARRIYDWIGDHLRYSYAREYSTLNNISESVYRNRYGDCGQIALFFITLCRIQGVPARWESGWMIYPELRNLHDWSVIYLHPYGWVPVDPNIGMDAATHFDDLSPQEKEDVRDFYFGKITPYRIVINSEHGATHSPPKQHWPSDTVDFQRGEIETESENLYYGRFTYRLEILSSEPISP